MPKMYNLRSMIFSCPISKGLKTEISLHLLLMVEEGGINNQYCSNLVRAGTSCLSSISCRVRGEDLIYLLCHSDKSGTATKFLQFGGSNVCTGGSNPSQNVLDCYLHVPSVLDLYSLALGGPGNKQEPF